VSLRLRLTLLYAGILAATLVAFSAALYVAQAQVTLHALETTLARTAERLAERLPAGDPLRLPAGFDTGEHYVQTRRLEGEAVSRGDNLAGADLPLDAQTLAAVSGGRGVFRIAPLNGEEVLIYSLPVTAGGQPVGVLQVARSLAEHNQALQSLRRMLLVGCAAALLVAGLVSWAGAGLALHPVDRLTNIARTIGLERDFGRRVEHSGPNDEIRRLAETFNSMLAELQAAHLSTEQALQAQRRFVADASHELRTPLTTLRGNLELLRRKPPIPAKDREEILDDMAGEMERLIRLVMDLLSLARADAHRQLQQQPVPLQALLEDVRRQMTLLAPERRIECAAPEGLAARGDRDAVKQLLLILLDNALKHTPPEAHVSVDAAPDGAGQVVIRVCDTGPGIPPEAVPHLFDRFFRADTSRASPGTGLGLPIAKMLAEAQNGEITVESQLGQGSTFSVRLPRA
jgi:signal transduction histidine kinase